MNLDCGDNSCFFAKDKSGMRTNGGCNCFSAAGFKRSAIQSAIEMLPEIIKLREANKSLEESVVNLLETLSKFSGQLPSPIRDEEDTEVEDRVIRTIRGRSKED